MCAGSRCGRSSRGAEEEEEEETTRPAPRFFLLLLLLSFGSLPLPDRTQRVLQYYRTGSARSGAFRVEQTQRHNETEPAGAQLIHSFSLTRIGPSPRLLGLTFPLRPEVGQCDDIVPRRNAVQEAVAAVLAAAAGNKGTL